MVVSQKEQNVAKSMLLVGSSLHVIQALYSSAKEANTMDDASAHVDNVIIGNGMLGNVGKCSSPEQACNKEFEHL